MHPKRTSGGYAQIILLVAAVVLIALAVFLFLDHSHNTKKPTTQTVNLSNYCVGRSFSAGSTGHCVADVQTIINYMEDSGLTQCPFENGAQLTVSSAYDAATVVQVKSVQTWASCYAKQEGFTTNVQQTGTIDNVTWGELCTYGYTNPSHNGASNASLSIAAGKDAGCAQLES
ncbi:MAG TPA: hypothetical protein VMB52_01915 [Verrucomicrobiae bacterium]|nr:hypothetical protein [Verrucomicrobiae bacterium]